MILKYDYFEKSFNEKLFENSNRDLLRKIAECPERYIGLFRPTKPRTKIIQNITHSHEIRYGDALEYIFERYFEAAGFTLLQKRFRTTDGKELSIDQLFSKGDILYMIEQKVRDDHDSTKKIGQFENFENKYLALTQRYPSEFKEIIPIMWFIDDSLDKNKSYYSTAMERMAANYGCSPQLYYGEKMFSNHPEGISDFDCAIWEEFHDYLEKWKESLPDMPEINFDVNAKAVYEEIKDIKSSVFLKLFENDELKQQIFPIIFPEGRVLRMLKDNFDKKSDPIYKTLSKLIADYIDKYL